jgi:hypothetical protein
MPSHDDELNRLLDALALGTPPGSLDLDRETVETASRLMGAGQSPHAPAGFAAHLEESLLQRASMQPVAVTGRIEHIGEGIGLVAARPMPRRLRIERIAAIAAVALLLLAASTVFRSDSDNGNHWLMAPVASASPVSDTAACPQYTQQVVDQLRTANYPTLPGNGMSRFVSADFGSYLTIHPESFIPTGPSADTSTAAELEARAHQSPMCWGGLALNDKVPQNVVLRKTIQLADDRVAAIYDYTLDGIELHSYVAYVNIDSTWYWYEARLVMPDDELASTSTVAVQSSWTEQLFDTGATVDRSSGFAIPELHVPADQPVQLTLKNVSSVAQHFTLDSSDPPIDVVIAAGSSKTVTALFAPGWTYFSTSGASDTLAPAVGYLYAEASGGSPTASTEVTLPATADCPTAEEFLATTEANGLPANALRVQVPGVVPPGATPPSGADAQASVTWQPAPNDPDTLIQVIPSSELPLGNAPDATVQADIAARIPNDLYCFLTGGTADPASPIDISQMSTLSDGSVGVLLDSDPLGFGVQVYANYVRGTAQWIVSSIEYVLPDPLYTAPDNLAIETRVRLQGWISNKPNGAATSAWPGTSGVPANTDVVIEAVNLDDDPLTFELPGAGISVPVAPGTSQEVTLNLSEGVYRYGFSDPANTSGVISGYLFVVASDETPETPVAASTPLTGTCNQVDIGFSAMDRLIGRGNTAFSGVVVREAPSDPKVNYGVVAYEDLPQGSVANPEVASAITAAVANDEACAGAGLAGVIPSISDYYSQLTAESQGTPRADIATATIVPSPESVRFAMPEILEIRQFDAQTVGVLTASPDNYPGVQNFQFYSLTGDTWVRVNAIFVAPANWIAETIPGPPASTLSGNVWDEEFISYEPGPAYFPFEASVPGNQQITIDLNNPTNATVTLEIEGSNERMTIPPGQSVVQTVILPPGMYRLAMYADDVLLGRGFLYATSSSPASPTPAG